MFAAVAHDFGSRKDHRDAPVLLHTKWARGFARGPFPDLYGHRSDQAVEEYSPAAKASYFKPDSPDLERAARDASARATNVRKQRPCVSAARTAAPVDFVRAGVRNCTADEMLTLSVVR